MIRVMHNENAPEPFFQLYDDTQGELGLLYYSWSGKDRLIITHTEVKPEMRGRNLGKLMLQEIVDYARAQNLKIIPRCSYASAVFRKKKEEYADVV